MKIGKLENFKILKISKFRNFENFENLKNLKISKFQNFQNPTENVFDQKFFRPNFFRSKIFFLTIIFFSINFFFQPKCFATKTNPPRVLLRSRTTPEVIAAMQEPQKLKIHLFRWIDFMFHASR